ncbi:hypothetical protein [Acidaminobacter hydrogenoformans]|uniref:hypothetical protein n=1 Tax=Acidaminobacter hydrogenoformans TaxID=65403 RepID=UPI001113F913|nr:hypothetical protein [Acidaminobacter hydrogenoformans]
MRKEILNINCVWGPASVLVGCASAVTFSADGHKSTKNHQAAFSKCWRGGGWGDGGPSAEKCTGVEFRILGIRA